VRKFADARRSELSIHSEPATELRSWGRSRNARKATTRWALSVSGRLRPSTERSNPLRRRSRVPVADGGRTRPVTRRRRFDDRPRTDWTNVDDRSTCVVTIRAWFEGSSFRSRMLFGSTADDAVEEYISASIDDTCAALAAYLRERAG